MEEDIPFVAPDVVDPLLMHGEIIFIKPEKQELVDHLGPADGLEDPLSFSAEDVGSDNILEDGGVGWEPTETHASSPAPSTLSSEVAGVSTPAATASQTNVIEVDLIEDDEENDPLEGCDGVVRCGVCSYYCLGHALMDDHVRRKHLRCSRGVTKVKCDKCCICMEYCNNPGAQGDSVQIQPVAAPSDRSKMKCGICRRQFQDRAKLDAHVRTVHRVKFFKCMECGITFEQARELAAHSEIHADSEQLRYCDKCDKLFTRIADFVRHSKSHGFNHICTTCSMSFVSRNELIAHMKWHSPTPYVCLVCSRRYTTQQKLSRHLKSHENRRYRCKICSAYFVWRYHLKQHMRTHTGERPYGCLYCAARFCYAGDRTRHVTKFHSVWSL